MNSIVNEMYCSQLPFFTRLQLNTMIASLQPYQFVDRDSKIKNMLLLINEALVLAKLQTFATWPRLLQHQFHCAGHDKSGRVLEFAILKSRHGKYIL